MAIKFDQLLEALDPLLDKNESLKYKFNEAFNRYTFGQDFEKYIPHNMRYKEYDFVKDNGQDILYWITQDTFDDSDIEDFKYVLSNETDFDGALVILRDDSSYNYDKDKNSGKGAFIKNSYAEEDFEESLTEEEFSDEAFVVVVTTYYNDHGRRKAETESFGPYSKEEAKEVANSTIGDEIKILKLN